MFGLVKVPYKRWAEMNNATILVSNSKGGWWNIFWFRSRGRHCRREREIHNGYHTLLAVPSSIVDLDGWLFHLSLQSLK